MTPRLVLASTSRYRRALLERLGLPFETAAPGVDEDAYKARGLAPQALVLELARAKALAVARDTDAIVIGSDQVAEIDGLVLGKPGTPERAVQQLQRLAGRTHHLWTGVCVVDGRSGRQVEHVDLHRLTMRALTAAQLAAYVAQDDPVDCAGAYKIDRVEGDDATAIVGLPLMFVARALAELGVDVFAA